MTTPLVRLRDVFVAFPRPSGAVMALRGADLDLEAGERLLVQGPNGSGKSTLLSVMTGEQAVVAGTVEVGGTALHLLDADPRRQWRARAVGFLDQHARRNLLGELNVLDNVALQLRLTGTPPARARRRARQALDDLALSELAVRRVVDLSGGEAQRVAVCAAVAHQPSLVLADEPTGELDERSAQQVYDMLSRIAASGTAVVLVSHDPRSGGFADRVVRVRDGRVAEQWRPGEDPVQLPDSRGWVRIPAELLAPAPYGSPLAATRRDEGVLLQPRPEWPGPGDSTPHQQRGDEQPALPAQDGPHGAGAPVVELAAVTAGYPGQVLFTGLDLRLGRGEQVTVTGPSGSGKTTLLSLVVGLADPVSGTVSVGGLDWRGLDRSSRAELRRQWVAYTPQRPSLVEPLTVAENLELTVALRGADRERVDVWEAGEVVVKVVELGEVLAALGLSLLVGQPVARLSGGERQRVAIARGLVSGAPILVLDEPTSQQDESSAALVVTALRSQTSAGRTVLVSSHDQRLVELPGRTLALGGTSSHG